MQDDIIQVKSRAPLLVGVIALSCYLLFIARSFLVTDGWMNNLLQNHYVFFVGLPFAGFLAYFVVGTLENIRGAVEFEIIGIKFKGASGPILMWIITFLSIVLSMHLAWQLKI